MAELKINTGYRINGQVFKRLPAAMRAQAAAELEHDLRQLRGLARPGLATDDDDLVRLDGGADFVAPGRNRQGFRKLQLHRQIIMPR